MINFDKFFHANHNCTFECEIKTKSIVRFVVTENQYWVQCKDDTELCGKEILYELHKGRETDKLAFSDVYYNYVIGLEGKIYEGRSLHCPFDEPSTEDHSSIITIGIPFCFPGNSKINIVNKIKQAKASKMLLLFLINSGILIKNYSAEIPKDCESNLQIMTDMDSYTSLFRERISYHGNKFYYIKDAWDQRLISNLLFTSNNVTGESKPIHKLRNNPYSLLWPLNTFCYNKSSVKPLKKDFDKITIRFMVLNYASSKYRVYIKEDQILGLKEIRTIMFKYQINYFVDLDEEETYQSVPLHCTLASTKDHRLTITIAILRPPRISSSSREIYSIHNQLPLTVI